MELAHEALIRTWGRLRGWLDESRDDLRTQQWLAAAAADWAARGREPSYLAIGARLEQLAAWASQTTMALTADEQAYLDASLVEYQRREQVEQERQQYKPMQAQMLAAEQAGRAEAEQQRAAMEASTAQRLRERARVLMVAIGGLVVVVAAALVLAVLAGLLSIEASRNAQEADQQRTTAVAARQMAERQGSGGSVGAAA